MTTHVCRLCGHAKPIHTFNCPDCGAAVTWPRRPRTDRTFRCPPCTTLADQKVKREATRRARAKLKTDTLSQVSGAAAETN